RRSAATHPAPAHTRPQDQHSHPHPKPSPADNAEYGAPEHHEQQPPDHLPCLASLTPRTKFIQRRLLLLNRLRVQLVKLVHNLPHLHRQRLSSTRMLRLVVPLSDVLQESVEHGDTARFE